jgi:glyoxalase family protein
MTTEMTTQTSPPSTTTPTVQGLHHVTAITATPQANIDFYTAALGLRLVKVTVNYDDPSSYHLYYGDSLGTPGTILTFFAYPEAGPGRTGTGQVAETAFAVPTGSLDFWQSRLAPLHLPALDRTTRFDDQVLTFRDPEGLPLALIESPATFATHLVARPDIPVAHALRAFHSVTLLETSESAPASILINHFGYRESARSANRIRYTLESAAPNHARTVDVLTTPHRILPAMGAGQVHHVAFRTPDDPQQARWLDLLLAAHHRVSPIMNRDYFHSIYFREPGGTLFEIATDNPGFTFNQTAAELGTRLVLPPWLEPQRPTIEQSLPKLKLPAPGVS